MCRFRKTESRTLYQTGLAIFQDETLSIPQRIGEWRHWIREYHRIMEKKEMELFEQENGFAATDDAAKRALIDHMCKMMQVPLPTTDAEYNTYTYSRRTAMMQIGWFPQYQ